MDFSFGYIKDRGSWIEIYVHNSFFSKRKSSINEVIRTDHYVQINKYDPFNCTDDTEATIVYNYINNIL